MRNTEIHPAKWWKKNDSGRILCTLCPRYCTIPDGKAGFCFIRQNINGQLVSTGYGRPTGFAVDPVEKKPLFHFHPGSDILSFGTAGCNLGCKFCQNWTMSKARSDDLNALYASAEDVIELAGKYNTPSIAFTYNEPIIFGEYVIDISLLARRENIKTVMVTNGYIDKEARKEVFAHIDAANVDLKAFSDSFYQKLTYSHLNDVLDTLLWLKRETDVWFEITTLLIPGENDSCDEIKAECDWILENLGDEVPLHFTAFHPAFRMMDHKATPPATLTRARTTALEAGIKYVYMGNVFNPEGQTTFCPACGAALIKRDWHTVFHNSLNKGRCSKCGQKISGRW